MAVPEGTPHYESIEVFANEDPANKKAIYEWFAKMATTESVHNIGVVTNVVGSRDEVGYALV